jgi:hypothetical protein
VLKIIFCGDQTAADYALISLVSTVRSRTHDKTVGQININMNNYLIDPKFQHSTPALINLLNQVNPFTLGLKMSIKLLEEEKFSP